MTYPNLMTPDDWTMFWNDFHWALSQGSPFILLVIASFAVFLIIRQVTSVIRKRNGDDIYDSYLEEED